MQGWSRALLLFMMSVWQAIIATVGDIISASNARTDVHPRRLLESFCYVNIIYALAATFRHIARAASRSQTPGAPAIRLQMI